MKNLTSKAIKKYLIDNYGECRHDPDALKKASQRIAKKYKCKAVEVFHFMIEQTSIPGKYTHSYGFNTRLGRYIREEFEHYYYNIYNK